MDATPAALTLWKTAMPAKSGDAGFCLEAFARHEESHRVRYALLLGTPIYRLNQQTKILASKQEIVEHMRALLLGHRLCLDFIEEQGGRPNDRGRLARRFAWGIIQLHFSRRASEAPDRSKMPFGNRNPLPIKLSDLQDQAQHHVYTQIEDLKPELDLRYYGTYSQLFCGLLDCFYNHAAARYHLMQSA